MPDTRFLEVNIAVTDSLPDAAQSLAGRTVIVLGDLMLDTFVYGQCERISPEAPIPVMRVEREEIMLGGAGNVARNIVVLGGRAVLIGAVGDDPAADRLRARIGAEGAIHADLVVDPSRPTTQKTRFVVGPPQLPRGRGAGRRA